MTLTSCTDDLNVTPKDDDEFLSETFFQDPESYKQVLAKLYAMYLWFPSIIKDSFKSTFTSPK